MASFDQLQKRRAESERGAILVLTALVILLLLFIAAFATDLGAWYRQTEEQQRAADVGSLNGISAYDRGVKQVFAANGGGVDTWQELLALPGGAALVQDAEREGLIEATLAIQALLETSGLSFTTSPAPTFTIAADPLDPTQISTVTLVADDGSIITISRVFVQTGVGVDGVTPTYSRAIEVSIERTGEQYFSNILRDAPQIERNAQSLLSNCGATCNNPVTFNPPFVGFDAPGNGDGHTPLLLDTDFDGIPDEVWAVNHHASGTPISNPDTAGSLICFGVESTMPCEAQHFDLLYATHTSPIEHLHTDNDAFFGRLYFAGVDQNLPANPTLSGGLNSRPTDPDTSDNRVGLVCFDTQSRSYCPTPFAEVATWTMDTQVNWGAWINVNGPFRVGDRLYIFSQDGQGACFNLDMTSCPVAGAQDLGLANAGRLPGLNENSPKNSNGIQFQTAGGRDRIAWFQDGSNGAVVSCLDVESVNGQITNCGDYYWNYGGGSGKVVPFERYNHAGERIGTCGFNVQHESTFCIDLNGNNAGALPGMNAAAFGGGVGGTFVVSDSLTWDGKRTFIATGGNNLILCWDWTLGSSGNGAACTDGPDRGGSALLADQTFLEDVLGFPSTVGRSPGTGVQTYAFAEISDRCLIALGDEAIFFSFDPEGFGPCVDVQITTIIEACDCADETAGTRWGPLSLPPALLADVEFLEGTVRNDDGSLIRDDAGNVIEEFRNPIDLLDTGGVIDLSLLNDLSPRPDRLELTLDADSKLDSNGDPEFADPYTTNLAITVQPTLTE